MSSARRILEEAGQEAGNYPSQADFDYAQGLDAYIPMDVNPEGEDANDDVDDDGPESSWQYVDVVEA